MRAWAAVLAWMLAPASAGAHVILDAPNGGETFVTGETVTLRWHIAILHGIESWRLDYAVGASDANDWCSDQPQYDWIPITSGIPPTCTESHGNCATPPDPEGCFIEYEWMIPESLSAEHVKVRVVMETKLHPYYDVSNESFRVAASTPLERLTWTRVKATFR